MKKHMIYLAAVLALASCTLDEKIVSSSVKEEYYQTAEQCVTGLNGCYIPMRTVYANNAYFQVTEAVTDIMYLNQSYQRNSTLEVSPLAPQFGSTMWTQGYLGVMRSNAMAAAITKAPLDDEEKLPLLAEANILRAFYYYFLTCNFGDVPYYLEEVTDANNARIAQLGRMPASRIRNEMIDSLTHYLVDLKALPLKRTYDVSNDIQNRMGASMGLMLAGKMAMWEERWETAKLVFGMLEDIYGNGAGNPAGALARYPLTDIPFGVRCCPESIWEISNYQQDYGLSLTGTLASICTPARSSNFVEGDAEEEAAQDVSDIFNGVSIPELGNNARTQAPVRPTNRFWKTLMNDPTLDKRCSAYDLVGNPVESAGNLAWGWMGYDPADTLRAEPSFKVFTACKDASGFPTKAPYLGNKFWCFGMQSNLDHNNYKIYRFAGVLLNLAEVHLQLGDMAKACEYLNEVRARAGLKPLDPARFTTETLMSEIQDECARELFGEFQRKHDLVRWGIWYEVTKANSGTTMRATNIRPCHRYYPIPAQQVTYSGGNLDNDEYNKYGL